MKKLFIASVLLAALAIFGCATTPTKLERKFFDIQTNRVASAVVVTWPAAAGRWASL